MSSLLRILIIFFFLGGRQTGRRGEKGKEDAEEGEKGKEDPVPLKWVLKC